MPSDWTVAGFGRAEVLDMFEQMIQWLGCQQVMDDADPHYGSIYFPTEDRYCNRDTACAAMAFIRQSAVTGDDSWRRKASLARDYVLRAQEENGGYPEMRGQEKSDGGSAVNTSVISANLIRTYQLGLDLGERDLRALQRMADFTLTLEWQPGAFYHDTNHLGEFRHHETGEVLWGPEGSKRDCQNTTALAAMMLQRIYHFLGENGADTKEEWPHASERGLEHLLAGQDSEGHWPYYFDADWLDVGHHAMCMFDLAGAAQFPPHRESTAIREALARSGQWLVDEGLLQTKRGTKINWAISRSACLYFTCEYFLTAAPLARLAVLDPGRRDLWAHEALELVRYVRTDLWDNPNAESEGPFKLTEAGIRIGYAWFGQSMGWAAYQLADLIEQMGWWE